MGNKGINNTHNHPPALNSALSAESIDCNRKTYSLSNASLGNITNYEKGVNDQNFGGSFLRIGGVSKKNKNCSMLL